MADFQPYPLSLVGATSKNKSSLASNQETKNWYPEVLQAGGVSPTVLLPWWGTAAFGSNPGTKTERGSHIWQDTLYEVIGTDLYEVSNTGTYTSKGTIGGSARCIFSNSTIGATKLMVIATEGTVYTFDGTTITTTAVSASDVTYLNSKSIYPTGGFEFSVSGAGGPGSITSTGSAESTDTDLLRCYAFNQWVYMFKEDVIEPFYDNGATSGVPFARIDNAIMQKGLGGFYTIAETDRALYFWGDDYNVYQIIQSQLKAISPPDVVDQIKSEAFDNSIGYTVTIDGVDFYILRLARGMSWAYIEQLDEWINLSSGTDDDPYHISSIQRIYDKLICVDFDNGNTVELTDTAFDQSGATIQRRRVTKPFTPADMGIPKGNSAKMSHIIFTMQKGTGLATGQGSDPQIMVEYSLDGGETWSTERWLEFGRMGKKLLKVKYDEMVSFTEICFRITVSDPVYCSLMDATIFAKPAGY